MMMQGIRKAGESWLGKLVLFVMFGFLIVSFAIWGIGDIFRGRSSTTAAKVGSTEISQETLRAAYQNEVQAVSRRARQPVTPELARALGLDQQVLSRLLTEATIDQAAKRLGVAVSDELVARSITEDQNFKDRDGVFDKRRFDDAIRSAGFTEASFVREQRGLLQRLQVGELISGGVRVPAIIEEAGHRYRSEQRAVSFFTLPPAAAGTIDTPDDATLRKFFDERKAAFRAPEYRSANIMVLTAAAIANPAAVPEADARRRYDEIKSGRFGTAERRTIQQIVFPSESEARAARERVAAGTAFEAIAAERKISDGDLTLGTFEKSAIFDKAVAEAAFALSQGAVSDVVAGAFGPVLLRVPAIEPARLKAFDEVAGEVRQEIALQRARDAVNELHDRIEDQRAGARPLAEIAREKNLALKAIGPVDANLRDKAGAAEAGGALKDVPSAAELVQAMFRTEIGADTEPLRLHDGGYIWFDVTAIEPSRERDFDEVKAEVTRQWLAEETTTRLAAAARALVNRIDQGEAIAQVAQSVGAALSTAGDVTREARRADLPQPVVSAIFGVPAGRAGQASLGEDAGRIVFKVDTVTVPPFLRTTQEAERLAQQLSLAIGDDLLSQYVRKKQAELGLVIDPRIVRNAIGGGEN
jgi:peptidyl-prolyl cis-trans isomerase D